MTEEDSGPALVSLMSMMWNMGAVVSHFFPKWLLRFCPRSGGCSSHWESLRSSFVISEIYFVSSKLHLAQSCEGYTNSFLIMFWPNRTCLLY